MDNTAEEEKTVYIGIGSNLEQPLQQVSRAVEAIAQLDHTEVIAQSPWYRSKALGEMPQPDYINGVIAVNTTISPLELLDQLQAIETRQGRQRWYRWAPRTLDLDILLFGQQLIDSERLNIPHPEMTKRNFVLYPLFDIAAELILPSGESLAELLHRVPPSDLEAIETSTH
ncbi:2-amino-4-hydroxy-6-hydroxymethyldihydropteridine diphosphokinase [bacterium]|nr:2-amino-4-hydroxy-6-hydroxymethyldihydropteridine diphosphokinase [bacterium]